MTKERRNELYGLIAQVVSENPKLASGSLKRAGSTAWPRQHSGFRFEYRTLNGEWQVYGDGLTHVCMCVSETNADMVTRALNGYMPS